MSLKSTNLPEINLSPPAGRPNQYSPAPCNADMNTANPTIQKTQLRLFPLLRQRWKLKLITLLITVLIFQISLALAFYLSIQKSENQTRKLAGEQILKRQELDSLRSRLQTLEEELAILVQTRSPELYPLEFDKAIPINKEYFENIRFTLPQGEVTNIYSVSILAKQPSRGTASFFEISFFDRTGVQIATDRINISSNSTLSAERWLSDKLFSLTSQVRLDKDIKPAYFAIKLSDHPEN